MNIKQQIHSDTLKRPSHLDTDLELPFSEAFMRENNFSAWRCLADGTVLAVGPMLFDNGRLFVDVDIAGYADCFCYDSLEKATESLFAFNPATDKEPSLWKRHPATGRRRPNGDAAQEFVAR